MASSGSRSSGRSRRSTRRAVHRASGATGIAPLYAGAGASQRDTPGGRVLVPAQPGAAAWALPTWHDQVLRCAAALRVTAGDWPRRGPGMTSTLRRQALIGLHTALGTWTRCEFGVH
jgi:hypothetical protein